MRSRHEKKRQILSRNLHSDRKTRSLLGISREILTWKLSGQHLPADRSTRVLTLGWCWLALLLACNCFCIASILCIEPHPAAQRTKRNPFSQISTSSRNKDLGQNTKQSVVYFLLSNTRWWFLLQNSGVADSTYTNQTSGQSCPCHLPDLRTETFPICCQRNEGTEKEGRTRQIIRCRVNERRMLSLWWGSCRQSGAAVTRVGMQFEVQKEQQINKNWGANEQEDFWTLNIFCPERSTNLVQQPGLAWAHWRQHLLLSPTYSSFFTRIKNMNI